MNNLSNHTVITEAQILFDNNQLDEAIISCAPFQSLRKISRLLHFIGAAVILNEVIREVMCMPVYSLRNKPLN